MVGELENRVIDHVCYRCETEEQYHDAVALMVGAGHEVPGTSIIGGRPISTIRLKKPIKWKKWEIPAVEIPMPKPGRPKRKGWEHAEVALMTDGDGKPLDFKGTRMSSRSDYGTRHAAGYARAVGPQGHG